MSSSSISARGKRNGSVFILSCLRMVFSEQTLHGRWLPSDQLQVYMHMKFNIGDDIKFTLASMMRVINKMFPLMGSEPNIIEASGGVQLRVFRHSFQNRNRRYFFWVTTNVGVMPSLPSQLNATAWEQDRVLTRLLAGGREQPLEINMSAEPEPKRQRSCLIDESILASTVTATDEQTHTTNNVAFASLSTGVPLTADWWESGDARRLFAPCSVLYGTDCDVKEIVMERIELLESVNCAANNWKSVVDMRMGFSSERLKSHYSESDIYSHCDIGVCTWLWLSSNLC
jgi:hypothetical protein